MEQGIVNDIGYWLYSVMVRMGNSARLAEWNSPFVLNRIKLITSIINWLFLFRKTTNDESIKYIITVSFVQNFHVTLPISV